MSARKIQTLSTTPGDSSVTVQARETKLTLSPTEVDIHRGGIAFHSDNPFPRWVEMTVTIQLPSDGTKVSCSGVVIECSGNKHHGYDVSMVFTGLTKQAESSLSLMALTQPR